MKSRMMNELLETDFIFARLEISVLIIWILI